MGEKINATFDFVKENWRVWLKFMLYGLLPLCFVQGMGIDSFFEGILRNDSFDGIMSTLLSLGFFVLVGAVILITVNLVLVKAYEERPGNLDGITFKELWPMLWPAFLRVLLVGVVSTVVFIPIYLVLNIIASFIPLVGSFVAYACVLPCALWPVVYVYEQPVGWYTSLKKAVKTGISRFVQLGFMGIVMGFLVSILQLIVVVPWCIILFVKYQLFNDIGAVSMVIEVLQHVASVASCFAVYVSCAFMVISLVFHYGSVTTATDGASLAGEIENFENL